MRIALDTNAYSQYVNGDHARLKTVQGAVEIAYSVIVLGELRAGFARGSKRLENENTLNRLLATPRARILPIDGETTRHYAYLLTTLKQQGTPIPTNDIWIAASVIQHGLTLCTSDEHFRNIPHLPLI